MNEELKEIFEKDQADRSERNKWFDQEFMKEVSKKDEERREKVQQLIDEGKLETGDDYYHAAMVFQHGDKPADYKLANELAQKAMESGSEKAKWLYAATLDRYLLSVNRPQKFGTQFRSRTKDEVELIEPIDPSVTDEERAKYGVPPLAEAVIKFKENIK